MHGQARLLPVYIFYDLAVVAISCRPLGPAVVDLLAEYIWCLSHFALADVQ
jgi:hypothetical protein